MPLLSVGLRSARCAGLPTRLLPTSLPAPAWRSRMTWKSSTSLHRSIV